MNPRGSFKTSKFHVDACYARVKINIINFNCYQLYLQMVLIKINYKLYKFDINQFINIII